MKKILLFSVLLSNSLVNAQIVLGNDKNTPIKAGEILSQQNERSGITSPGNDPKVIKGLNATNSKNIATGSSAKVLSPGTVYNQNDTVTISKKEYEQDLKRRGLTQEQDLKRAKSLEVDNDGIIRSDIDFVTKSNGISVFEAQKQQIQKELEEIKNAAKIESVKPGENGKFFQENAQRNIETGKNTLKNIEKEMLYGKPNIIHYDILEKQIEMMNVLIEAKYSKDIDGEANKLKTSIYSLMRQIYPYIWEENIKGLEVNSFGIYHKTLKIVSPQMNSNEVVKLRALLDGAFVIGFDRVIFTNQRGYVVEETVQQYIKKIKESKKNK